MTKNQIDAVSWGVGTVGFIIFLMAIFTKIISFGWGLVILIVFGSLGKFIKKFVKPKV